MINYTITIWKKKLANIKNTMFITSPYQVITHYYIIKHTQYIVLLNSLLELTLIVHNYVGSLTRFQYKLDQPSVNR